MVVLIYLMTVWYCGMDLECRLPDWSMIFSCFLYFTWLILDNIDGKQARRTHTSSPLGLMFDHQVDAINVTITTTYLSNVLMAPHHSLIYWFIGAFPFYYTTWETNYTGSMSFPLISAASEGCILIGLLCFMFYIIGPEYFIFNTYSGYEYRTLLMYALVVGALMVVGYK